MGESADFAFQSENDAYEMGDTIHQPKRDELMTTDDSTVVIYKLDSKIKVRKLVYLMSAGMVGGAFWGMLIGMFALVLFSSNWIEDKVL